MKYTIPAIPPSNNRFIGRTNYREYQNIKKKWADLIALFCRPTPKRPVEHAIVALNYYFPDKRRRDPDNYSGKMVLDGLTKAGIITDDSFEHIDLVLRGKYDSQNPRIEIEIKEIEAC